MSSRPSATRHSSEPEPINAPHAGGGRRGWRLAAIPLAVMVIATVGSWAVGLDSRVTHWDKGLHVVDGALVALVVGWLVLGWRDQEQVALADELMTLLAMFGGLLFGLAWELFEFVRDWSLYSDVQKSNSDTMTDFLWNDFGAVVGALLAVRLYCRWLSGRQRQDLGGLAVWLADGPSRVLDRRGRLVLVLFLVFAAAAILAVWFASRPLPGLGVS